MNFDSVFAAMYTLYRAEAQTPASTDDEYTIAMNLANEAVKRWENYDNTFWKELFTTLQSASDGGKIITTSQEYAAPTDMREAAGYVKVRNASGNTVSRYPLIDPQEAQFRNENAAYAYFTGNPSSGYILHLSRVPSSSIIGMNLDYVYYKKATLYTSGTSKSEMTNPYFVVHRVLANRFRASRNPYYNSALREAEDALKIMQMENNSGSWVNPWSIPDRSGSSWGS